MNNTVEILALRGKTRSQQMLWGRAHSTLMRSGQAPIRHPRYHRLGHTESQGFHVRTPNRLTNANINVFILYLLIKCVVTSQLTSCIRAYPAKEGPKRDPSKKRQNLVTERTHSLPRFRVLRMAALG